MQTEAFVLDSQPSKEYDRSYTLLTKELGIIDAFAKSIGKPGAKLAGHLEPPHFSWVELIESNRGWQITSALEKESYREILTTPSALRIMLQAGWILRTLIPVSTQDEIVWKLWQEFSAELTRHIKSAAMVQKGILMQFLAKLLFHLGFFPAPEDVAPPGQLRENLYRLLSGEWLEEKQGKDPKLWEIVSTAVRNAQRLMI